MKRRPTGRIQDLIGLIHALYPPALAEEWDQVGLQVGDPRAEVSRVLVCLDVTPATLDEAERCGAQAVLSHHPLLFRPLRSLTCQDPTGESIFRAIRSGLTLIAAHTNLDCATPGLNDWLAETLGLAAAVPLQASHAPLRKLVVYVPAGHEETVAEALFAGGAGKVGGYDRCSFRQEGTGTFRPGVGTAPAIGSIGVEESVREIRLETIVPAEMVGRVVERMCKVHPYEEVAYDIIPLDNRRNRVGLGRIGTLAAPQTLGAFAEQVRSALGCRNLRLCGELQTTVRKVAVCGGSGASLIGEALRQGADVLVTGDVKYHEAQRAGAGGLALIDAGHFATEHLMVRRLAAALRSAAAERGMDLEFMEATTEYDPFFTV